MQLAGFENSTREAHDGQLWQPQPQDGRGSQNTVPKEYTSLLGGCQCIPVSSGRCDRVQVYYKGCCQPQVNLDTKKSQSDGRNRKQENRSTRPVRQVGRLGKSVARNDLRT